MRLHVGCGSVYLDGWLNLDVRTPKTFLAADRPDLVEKRKTSEDKYYGRHSDKSIETMRAGPLDQEYVCDAYGSFDSIPAGYWEVEEVLARHSFEHLSIGEAHRALDSIDEIMKPGGVLRLDVPDHEGTLKAYRESGDEFYVRHLLGPRRNEFGFHLMSYTRDRLKALVEDHGFLFEREEENIHFFPAFCIRFVKPGPRDPRDYVTLPAIPDHWRVADIGPGAYPLKRANVYIDHSDAILAAIKLEGSQKKVKADFNSGLPGIEGKSFDFVYCSHVLEHMPDPEKAAATLSRIAKSGIVVMPSAWKEALTNFEEREHLWAVLPNPTTGGPPIFVRNNPEQVEAIRNTDVQKILSHSFRTGPNNRVTDDGRVLRKWWCNTEPMLDVVYHWENELKLQVIG